MTNKQYISTDKIIELLGGEDRMLEIMINPAVSFVSGKVTSTFNALADDQANLITLYIYNCGGGEQKQIKKKNFTEKSKCDEWVKQDKEERLEKFKESYLQKNPDAKDPEIKSEFNSTFQYQITESKKSTLGTLATTPVAAIGAIGAASTFVNNPDMLIDAATNLVTEVTATITNSAMGLVTSNVEKITMHALQAPKMVQEYTMSTFNKNKLSISDLLKGFEETVEDELKKLEAEDEKKDQQTSIDKMTKAVSKIKSEVTKIASDANDIAEKITKYIAEGPDTVTSFVNNTIDEKISQIQALTNTEVNKWMKDFDGFCKTQGEKLGTVMAQEYNNVLRKQAQKITANIKKQKSKAKLLAFSAKQKSVLQIMGMTGINVPI